MIITTDHGRGSGGKKDDWRSPGKGIWAGSDETWFAAIGPDVRPGLEKLPDCVGANQVAATALGALGIDWKTFDAQAGAPLDIYKPVR